MIPLLVLVSPLPALGASPESPPSSVTALGVDVETLVVELFSLDGPEPTDAAELSPTVVVAAAVVVGAAEALLLVPSAVTLGAWVLVEIGSVASTILTESTPVAVPALVELELSLVLELQAGTDNKKTGTTTRRKFRSE